MSTPTGRHRPSMQKSIFLQLEHFNMKTGIMR